MGIQNAWTRKKQEDKCRAGEKSSPQRAGTTWLCGAGAPRSGSVEGGVVGRELLPQRPLSATSSRRPCGTPGQRSSYSSHDGVVSDACGAARDVDASALCASRSDIAQPSDHTTNTSGAGSGAGPYDLLDRPLLGAESPPVGGLTASRPLTDLLSERVRSRPWEGSRGTNACAAAAAASSCCGLMTAVAARQPASRRHTYHLPWHPLRAAPGR
jgi:hypothetical protein